MRRWRFIKEKTKAKLVTYLGETVLYWVGGERTSYSSLQPEITVAGKDVTTSDRNKTVSPSISYTTGVA
jgi:hypothetical protein